MQKAVRELKGVGAKTEKLLQGMGILTFYDLLTCYPKGYDFFSGVTNIAGIQEKEENYLRLKIVSQPKLQYFGKLTALSFYAADESGQRLRVTYFRQPYLAKVMLPSRVLILRGRPHRQKAEWQLINPAVVTEEELAELAAFPLSARYPVRKGISEKKWKQYLKQILSLPEDEQPVKDYIEAAVREKYGLLPLWESYRKLHFPKTKAEAETARKRLVFDEFYFFRAGMAKVDREQPNDFPLRSGALAKRLIAGLPFALTADQAETVAAIENDLRSWRRMVRLVQGDVGSGKTAVAFAAAAMLIENGYQAALMAPTEVLAVQHFQEAEKRLAPLGIKTVLLLGSAKAKEKKETYEQMASGQAHFIIGTHALIQEKAVYHNLGLVITDEQHRFGVMQRESLSRKGVREKLPHILVMSATPIPRTLALILYQDMDISVIKSMPTGRIPVQSFLRSGSARDKIYRFMEKEIRSGAAAYIICPAVEDNEELALTGVISYAQALQKKYPQLRIAYLYGGQPEKEEIMRAFAAGETDILISTTVVEVGVNVPRATVMLVENAERFGLAQLHQLRGRVGRGNRQSYCIFLSDAKDSAIREKLEFVAAHRSGFEIAEYDLKMRGPGDAFGVKQHGLPLLQLADLYQDLPVLEMVSQAAAEIGDSAERRQMLELYYGGSREILSI